MQNLAVVINGTCKYSTDIVQRPNSMLQSANTRACELTQGEIVL